MPNPTPSSPHTEFGQRLAAQQQRLHLLLHHLAGRIVQRHVEIEDLAQEVFLRAVTTTLTVPPAEPGERALWRFLARLARNTVVDAARSIRALKRGGDMLLRSDWSRAGPGAEQLLAQTAGPATRLIADEATHQLFEHFRALSPEHRRVLGLRQFEGLSAAETAARMGRSEEAIHSLYRRALGAWEAALKPTHHNFPDSCDESTGR